MKRGARIAVMAAAAVPLAFALTGCETTQKSHGHHHAHNVTKADVVAAQQEWGEGIVDISRVHARGGDATARATQHINELYAYDIGDVMFKPTLASQDQFRETFGEALDYFVGRAGTEDNGFAISGWTNVRWENNGIYTDSDSAMAMGNYFFSKADGSVTKVEYTFGYIVDDNGDLRINLHHSSLPFSP
ncbi:MAG: phosphoribosyl-AMP cyclohydrolase [Planctomycetota bacterium]